MTPSPGAATTRRGIDGVAAVQVRQRTSNLTAELGVGSASLWSRNLFDNPSAEHAGGLADLDAIPAAIG